MLSPSPDSLLSSYDFALPREAIAQYPSDARGGSRLLVASQGGGPAQDCVFTDLPTFLEAGDLVLLNDTRVLAARLTARRTTGGAVRLLALEPTGDGAWRCLVKPSAKVKVGETVQVERRGTGEVGPSLEVGERAEGGARLVRCPGQSMAEVMEVWGEMPLPPYIERAEGPEATDRLRYQTVFAAHDGAVAAPTAGLHFDERSLEALRAKGVEIAYVTLHVGAGTFAPVREDELTAHEMHGEHYRVAPATAEAITAAEQRSARIVCVGTTSARSLESWHRAGRPTDGAMRSTHLFLRPGDGPQISFSLLTNFHLPKSTLVVLVASLLGRERTLSLYEHALASGYRFYSYGDACLFL
ncbi:MAG: tRNA preQ1(34) S-adenosylmethionine ribosyltransferase-isomerase QueA [Deltaproteobacteria bacterium]|nr:tRNA preQ1(34) S-adenosylmethionine ribosyltransferase-isomerase QueA [Deltaproteobacteria bacterium]